VSFLVRIAIVIPAFNVAPFLFNTVLSVIGQSHTDWSLMIVDDGSTDSTPEVAAALPDQRIHLIRQDNAGVSAARNRGIRHARLLHPDAFLFLDGDDWLAPDALSLLADTLLAVPSAVAAVGRYARVALNGVSRLSAAPPEGCLLEHLLTRNLFANGGHLLIRREALDAIGDFRCDLSYGEDWEYWTRLALRGKFATVGSRSPVLFVRERSGSAYLSNATDPIAYLRPMEAIHQNPAIVNRIDPARLAYLRRRANAETAWSVGRELIRHGRQRDGLRWLACSVWNAPSLKRLALIGLSWCRVGPFSPYPVAA
jgi:glycosyltransferase involved in cell wall biosynthesis